MPIFLIFEDWWQKIKGCATVTDVGSWALFWCFFEGNFPFYLFY